MKLALSPIRVRFLFVRDERSGISCGQWDWGTHRQATLVTHKKEPHPSTPHLLDINTLLWDDRRKEEYMCVTLSNNWHCRAAVELSLSHIMRIACSSAPPC